MPSRDERHLFELLTLEGAQAGLAWSTILRKREGYRRAFANFDPEVVARLRRGRRRAVARRPGHRPPPRQDRVHVDNARAILRVREELGSFAELVWGVIGGEPRRNAWRSLAEIPAETDESRAMSRELKRRGFRFVGPTTLYAFMQAAGLVDDHVVGCFRHGAT